MSLSFPYCTVDDIKAQLFGLDASDIPDTLMSRLQDHFIPSAQRDVDRFCGTNFDATEVSELYGGNSQPNLILRHRPVRELLNVTLKVIPSFQWFQFRRWFYDYTTDGLGTLVARRGGPTPKNAAVTDPAHIPLDTSYVYDPSFGFSHSDANLANQTADFFSTDDQYGNADLIVNSTHGWLTIPPRIVFMINQTVPFWNYTWLDIYPGVQINIPVRYVYGYSDPTKPDVLLGTDFGNLPKEITTATAMLAAVYVLRAKSLFITGGAVSTTFDGATRNYGAMAFDGTIKYLEDKAHQLLKPYKLITV